MVTFFLLPEHAPAIVLPPSFSHRAHQLGAQAFR